MNSWPPLTRAIRNSVGLVESLRLCRHEPEEDCYPLFIPHAEEAFGSHWVANGLFDAVPARLLPGGPARGAKGILRLHRVGVPWESGEGEEEGAGVQETLPGPCDVRRQWS